MDISVKKAISILEEIPEDQFIICAHTNNRDKCCSMGHIKRVLSSNPQDYSYFNIMSNKVFVLNNGFCLNPSIMSVNDGEDSVYGFKIKKEVIEYLKTYIS